MVGVRLCYRGRSGKASLIRWDLRGNCIPAEGTASAKASSGSAVDRFVWSGVNKGKVEKEETRKVVGHLAHGDS